MLRLCKAQSQKALCYPVTILPLLKVCLEYPYVSAKSCMYLGLPICTTLLQPHRLGNVDVRAREQVQSHGYRAPTDNHEQSPLRYFLPRQSGTVALRSFEFESVRCRPTTKKLFAAYNCFYFSQSI
jgi:hypothetical protein